MQVNGKKKWLADNCCVEDCGKLLGKKINIFNPHEFTGLLKNWLGYVYVFMSCLHACRHHVFARYSGQKRHWILWN